MRGVLLGLAIAGLVAACATRSPLPTTSRPDKIAEITTLWAQIRGWRHDARMDLDPPAAMLFQWRGRTVREARMCPEVHDIPNSCGDVCSLGDDICDNAERICALADELGKDDQLAQDKCTSAKASCREAKQRCCTCAGQAGQAGQAGDGAPP